MRRYILPVFLLVFLCTFISESAQARIDILPRKVVIADRERSGEITLLNLGDKTGVFRIGMIANKQNADGSYTTLETPLNPAFDPEQYVRVSPRQFSLPPGGRQKVRISLRKPADLPEGEYRFHIVAMQYDQTTPQTKVERGAGVNMAINLGVTLPVIVRHGNTAATAKIENATLTTSDESGSALPAVKFDLVRSGNASTLGIVRVYWKPAAGGEEKEIGTLNGMNVFPELERRKVTISLKEMPSGPGTLRIRYTSDYGREEVIDEVALSK